MAAGANKVLPGGGGAGTPAVERVHRDVLARAGVRWAMIFEGVNDIGGAEAGVAAQKAVGDALIVAYQKMVLQMRAGGIKVFGGTITPFGGHGGDTGKGYSHPEREKTRQRVNDWIRKSGNFDGVVDFDAAVRDPEKKDRLARRYDTGDHLHLNSVGYQAMADFFNLDLFR
jgi:lysophospholipase L1-like esterase